MFAFFGQFFDHGLDLVTKGGGTRRHAAADRTIRCSIPSSPETPAFMVMTRGLNQPGPDGILGTADDVQEGMNTTTPWVDQNQTYTSHPSHQVFLREYQRTSRARRSAAGADRQGARRRPLRAPPRAPASSRRRRHLQHRQLGRGEGAGSDAGSASASPIRTSSTCR